MDISTSMDEVADARVFAGFHFRTACNDGRILGSAVAAYILFHERLTRLQLAGVVTILVGVAGLTALQA